MHPAFSVIVFSTATGAGYGLLVWLCIAYVTTLPDNSAVLITGFVVASVLIVAGLLSSTLHLGRPERAWRAVSQWRSSWLSREGILALFTFVPMVLLVVQWFYWPDLESVAMGLALLTIVSAMATVFTTSMIYASLKAIAAWSNPWTPPVYLLLSLMTGVLLYTLLVFLLHRPDAILVELTAGLILSGATIKILYWRYLGSMPKPSTPESATGLGQLGKVKQLQAPHTQENYLLKEMGFQVARKHAARLRQMAIGFGFVIPLLLSLSAILISGFAVKIVMLLAAIFMLLGVLIERWLFFAEARHTLTLYY